MSHAPRSFDTPGAVLSLVLPRMPQTALAVAGALGEFRHRLTRRWPSVDQVRSLFPDLARMSAEEAARGIAALNERNRLLVRAILRHGTEPLRPLVSVERSLSALDAPMILATYHVGAVHALGPALERLRRPVLALRDGHLIDPQPPLTILSTEGTSQARALALHQALAHLRGSGFVIMAVDDVPDRSIETRCLDRRLLLAPGAFALARWSGAPIVPVVARWRGNQIRVEAGHEVANPQEAATWLQDYLLDKPSELTLGLMRKLLAES